MSHDADALELRLLDELPDLTAFARRLVARARGAVEADDVVQETLVRALRYRHAFDPGRELAPWLRRTAYRAFLDGQSLAERRRRLRPEARPDAEAAADLVARSDLLSTLLARLSAVERDVLVRFHERGESVREIAARLGMPAGTVKSHLHRARRRLAERGPS